MPKVRLSTTIDEQLLHESRRVGGYTTDASLVEAALTALLAQHRDAEIETRYNAYDRLPLNEPDAWGDLASFRATAGAS